MSIFMKIRLVRADDRHDEASSRFSQFCESSQNDSLPENWLHCATRGAQTASIIKKTFNSTQENNSWGLYFQRRSERT